MLQRAWGQGAVRMTGRVRGGALLSKDAKSCVSPPNDSRQKSICWIAKSSAGGRHLLEKVTRRDDCQASSWPSWITNQLTKRTRRRLGSQHEG